MTNLQGIILGFFQGIAEFLPISSSGHLAVLQQFFGIEEGNLFVTEMLHFGTLISIVVVYWAHIKQIVLDVLKFFIDGFKNKKFEITTPYQTLGFMVIIATIPTGIIGIVFKDFFESIYTSSLIPIGISFLITGVLLWIGNNHSFGKKGPGDMTIGDSIFVGLLQGIAIFPGISRSGTTIVAGLMRNFDRELATEFSFLLAIPAILGAGLLGLIDVHKSGVEASFSLALILGMIVSCVVGIICIKFLINLLKRDKLHYFSYYLWVVGIITIISVII